jgi:hypothetical protein
VPYVKPNTLIANQPIEAADIKGNDDALKVYLHQGVVSSDLLSAPWIETRHVQQPVLDPITGVQHGVTGFQGSQWDGGVFVRCQFGTGFLTGKRYDATLGTYDIVPQTAMTIDLRRPATVIFKWWMESFNGPDNGPRSAGNDAYIYLGEYQAGGLLSGLGVKSAVPEYFSECRQNTGGFAANHPGGSQFPYVIEGYGNHAGTLVTSTSGSLAIGLVHVTNIDRCALLNWGVSLEVYYLRGT